MNKLKRILVSIVALCVAIPAFAQTLPTITTLSAAITGKTQQQIVVASATNITAPTSNQQPTTMLWIDKELLAVEAVSGTTITVRRGASGTRSTPHISGAYVYVGPPQQFSSNPTTAGDPSGTCTRGSSSATSVGPTLYLPYFNAATGNKSDCIGGVWVNGVDVPKPVSEYRLMFPDPGGTAYTSLNTSGTAVGATTLYCTEVNLPYNKVLTGIGVLNGTTVTANARYVVLYDAAGNALANSALAGQASVTASVYENYAFTSTFLAIGPAQYFGCLQDNAVGSTTVRMLVTGVQDNFLTKGQTSAVFGTIKALVPPTTFTSVVGPYIYLY